jgi:putative ubiquitin-RnfH superfamily antitoxin RatB of RatAB toxin-antitoxin module
MSYDVLTEIRETLSDSTVTIGELKSALSHAEAEVTRLQTHVSRASERIFEPGFANELAKFMVDLDLGSLPLGVYDKLYTSMEHIKDLERVATFAEDKHRIRDTRKGEWPELGQHIHIWKCYEWCSHVYRTEMPGALWGLKSQFSRWLPAPPPPSDD